VPYKKPKSLRGLPTVPAFVVILFNFSVEKVVDRPKSMSLIEDVSLSF
jgi:hypothetical protein